MKTKLISLEKDRFIKIFDNICLFSLYLIIFFLPISKAIIESLAILAIASFLIKKFIEFEYIPRTPLNPAIYGYLIICILSIFISSNLKISTRTFFAKSLEDIAFFFMVVETLNNERRLKNILYILFLSSTLIGIDGIYQHFTHKDFIRNRPNLCIPRIYGPFQTPNALGCYLTTVIPFVFIIIFTNFVAKLLRFSLVLLFILLFSCLLLTVSRGAWFAFGASALFMSIWIRSLGIFLLVVGIFIIVTQTFYHPTLKKRLTNFIFFSESDIDRKMIWQAGWRMFMSKPWLGVGLGTFMFNFKKFVAENYPYTAAYAHNCYLQMSSELGIIGLISFLGIIITFFYKGIKALNKNKKISFFWALLLASQAAVLGYSVQMGVDTILYSLDLGMLFWLVLGLGVSALKNLEFQKNNS